MARARGTKKIDFTHWTGFTGQFLAQAAGNTAIEVGAAVHGSETLLRTRGFIACWIDGAQGSGGAVQISIGMHVVSDGTGTSVLTAPSVATGVDTQWFWYDTFTLAYEEMVADVVDVPGMTSYRATIDSKSMRIVRNEQIQLVISNVSLAATLFVNASVTGRFLSGS